MLHFAFEKLGDGRFKQVFEGSKRFNIYSEHGLLLEDYSDKDGSTVYYEYDDQQSLIHQSDSYGFELYFTFPVSSKKTTRLSFHLAAGS